MIRRLLIANRGEIAVRIARTAHRLGIETVGVYSEPDIDALHVDLVDRAVALGGTSPASSYLRADAVLAAAVDTGCDAVHPGYGFLAENASFARAVVNAGLRWVGPTPEQIELLGDKVAAKRAALDAGVPTTTVIEIAGDVVAVDLDMPVLIKAAAGGGGRGMRVVRDHADLTDAIASASREAEAAFGDGTVFIEPYLEHGRHVEVQIIGDAHGNVVHLGERECSIQRRNQKVIEEAPSAGISAATRQTLCDGALALAQHVGYQNAGTVEFLVGADGTINFLEVNTRLQVEHPVTEAVTGLDLVELQLRVASGDPLPFAQEDVGFTGHAIEARLVAEDPAAGWLPSTGTLSSFSIGPGVRVDAGFRAGGVVSADYDSLLAKVISHASTRAEAAGVLGRALLASHIAGVRTDADCLVAVLSEPDFLAAATPTSYLADHSHVEQATFPVGADRRAQLAAAVLIDEATARAVHPHLGFAPSGWRNLWTHGQRQIWADGHDDTAVPVEVRVLDDWYEMSFGAWPAPTDDGSLSPDERDRHIVRRVAQRPGEIAIEVDGIRQRFEVIDDDASVHVAGPGGRTSWTRMPRFDDHDAAAAGGGPVAPLPGSVLSVHVSAGDRVDEGQLLVVVEAMKMEHQITAAAAGLVTEVRVSAGDRVDTGDILVLLDTEPTDHP